MRGLETLAILAMAMAVYQAADVHEGLDQAPTFSSNGGFGDGAPVLGEGLTLEAKMTTKSGAEMECGGNFATQSFTDENHVVTTTCTAPVALECPMNTKKSVMVDDVEDGNKQVTFKCENCNPGAEAPEGCELMFACTEAHCENYCKYSSGRDSTCRACPKDYTWKANVNHTMTYGRVRGNDPCRRSCNECAGKDGTSYYGYCIWVAAHNHMMVKENTKAKSLRNPATSDDEDCAVQTGNSDSQGGGARL